MSIDNSLEKDNYIDNGFIEVKEFLKQNVVDKLNEYIDSLEPVVSVPFSDSVPWGFGNLIGNDFLKELIDLNKIISISKNYLIEGDPICNHIFVVNKPPFIGPDVEWHQEFFNIDTYAPGYSSRKNLDNFVQIFIALDDHTLDNGPLYIFEGSHKEGLLPHEDIISPNLNHKRRVKYKSLNQISEKYKYKPVLLKKGEAVIFNHLLVHGSPTNCSPFRRRALLLQLRIDTIFKDPKIFDKEVAFRSKFVLEQCLQKRESILQGKLYKDQKFIKGSL